MKTYITEERIFAVEPLEDITTFELAIMMKHRFDPSSWFVDDSNLRNSYKRKQDLARLPKEVIRHFVRVTSKIKYETRYRGWWWLPNMDEEISREIIKTERVSDLELI
jgi:hypothetical protein